MPDQYPRSRELFDRAQRSIPGGVNSPVRAFKSVGGTPLFMKSAKGAYLYDEDGNSYIDYINSWGPMILGHAYQPVIDAIREKACDSTSFGAPTSLEIEMAEQVKSMVPNVDLIRMVNSGTEACLSAIRLARGFTGRNKFIKFEGCYHGHADCFLVKAGSGVATLNIQEVPGIPAPVSADTLIARYNDIESVKQLVEDNRGEIAAIIIEPVAGNMGCILPSGAFLPALREICDKENIVLIFDEVMTGFRLAPGGAQEHFSVQADLITYGKVIGGGLPVGAFGGRRDIMEMVAPIGKVYQAGTLSGNPLAMIAGLTTLKILQDNKSIYNELSEKATSLASGMMEILKQAGVVYKVNQVGSMMSLHFSGDDIVDFTTAANSDIYKFNALFHHMLTHGIYLPPSAYESWFLSNALTDSDLEKTLDAFGSFDFHA